MLKKKDLDHFNKYGYIKVNLFNKKELIDISLEFKNFLTDKNETFTIFRKNLKSYKNIDKTKFQKLMKLNDKIIILLRFCSQKKIFDLLKKLDLKNPILSGNPQFRTDFPKDKKYSQPPHQDILYNLNSRNAVTIWTCLHDCKIKDGALSIYESSHKHKVLKYKKKLNPRRFEILNLKKLKFKKIFAETKFGESLIFDQKIVHASGINKSSKVRISFQSRYADLDSLII